jgi:Ni/Co efflux regulator RcnB
LKKNLILSVMIIVGLFSISLACGINFAGNSTNNAGSSETETLKLQLTLQALQMTQAVTTQNQQQPAQQQQQPAQPQQQQPPPNNQANTGPTPTVDNGIPCNSSKFVNETIPDFTAFKPGATFSKTWTLRNAGDCNWNDAYKFEFEEGSRMGGESVIPVTTVIEPNETITFKVNLKAPDAAGDYVGVWRLKAGDGELLGKYWVKITVGAPAAAFAVTGLQLSLDSGADPKVYAKITSSAAGTVTYKWLDNGGTENPGSVKFNAAGTKTINIPVSLGTGGWVKIYIDVPNHQWFGPIAVP